MGNTVITVNVEVQTLQIRVKTQLYRPTLQARGKYLFNFTKKAVMRCVGILWLPQGAPLWPWPKGDQLWSGKGQLRIVWD